MTGAGLTVASYIDVVDVVRGNFKKLVRTLDGALGGTSVFVLMTVVPPELVVAISVVYVDTVDIVVTEV